MKSIHPRPTQGHLRPHEHPPEDTRERADQPSDPIHEKLPVALFLLTALMTPATSWSEPKMMTPEGGGGETSVRRRDDGGR